MSSSPPKWFACVFDENIMSQLDLGTIVFILLFMIDRAAFLRNPHFLSLLVTCAERLISEISFVFFSEFKLKQGLTLLFYQFVGSCDSMDPRVS